MAFTTIENLKLLSTNIRLGACVEEYYQDDAARTLCPVTVDGVEIFIQAFDPVDMDIDRVVIRWPTGPGMVFPFDLPGLQSSGPGDYNLLVDMVLYYIDARIALELSLIEK